MFRRPLKPLLDQQQNNLQIRTKLADVPTSDFTPRRPTAVIVLLPLPSWQLTTIGALDALFLTMTSIKSLRSVKSGGRSAVIGMRAYRSSVPSSMCRRAAIMSFSTDTFSLSTSSQTGMTDPSGVSVCRSSRPPNACSSESTSSRRRSSRTSRREAEIPP